MQTNTLAIELNGDVSLDDFAETIHNFKDLIEAVSKETANTAKIEWIIEDLHAGSTMAMIRGISENPSDVEKVVNAYGIIGTSLEKHTLIPFSDEVKKRAVAMTKVLNGKIRSLRFKTAFSDCTIVSHAYADIKPRAAYAFGTIKGTVQSLTQRGNLKFTLYDSIFDRAVLCYLKQEQKEIIRGAWGKKVSVSGIIRRQQGTGFPISVKEIKHIQTIVSGDYRLARGILPATEKSETIIRRLRDV